MLLDLQQRLSTVYQADCGHRITDFLVTDRRIAAALQQKPIASGVEETVLVAADEDGVRLSVFLDEALLRRVAADDPLANLKPSTLADLATVIEGISHFHYLAYSAGRDRSVTMLELELQAEVDKFVAVSLLALEQDDAALARCLHACLFDGVRYQPSLSPAQRDRYTTANDYAARFCHRIGQRLAAGADLQELRRFYRFSQPEKIGHIHATAWRKAGRGS